MYLCCSSTLVPLYSLFPYFPTQSISRRLSHDGPVISVCETCPVLALQIFCRACLCAQVSQRTHFITKCSLFDSSTMCTVINLIAAEYAADTFRKHPGLAEIYGGVSDNTHTECTECPCSWDGRLAPSKVGTKMSCALNKNCRSTGPIPIKSNLKAPYPNK